MEEKKTIFDYVGMVFTTFGFTIVILTLLCFLFGEDAKEISSMFSLGKEGLSIAIMTQYLMVSVLIVALRFLFFTDVVIKNMSVTVRTLCMLLSVIGIIVFFIIRFGWFPIDMWIPWFMFIVCFGICFVVSTMIAVLKERAENRKMEEALTRLKQQNERSGE